MDQVDYLGFTFDKNGISPGNKNVQAVVDFPTPTDIHRARQFHGLASFFRRFIPSFSKIIGPIIELFKDNTKFVWDKRQEKAFLTIKKMIASKPILEYFNVKAICTELHTDASPDGLGAMLFQGSDKRNLRLVYTISRRTNETERVYHSSKLELLPVFWSVDRLRHLLIHCKKT